MCVYVHVCARSEIGAAAIDYSLRAAKLTEFAALLLMPPSLSSRGCGGDRRMIFPSIVSCIHARSNFLSYDFTLILVDKKV